MFTKINCITVFIILGFTAVSFSAEAQANVPKASDTLPSDATVQACVEFALKHYPQVQQALLDEQITDRQIRSRLAAWYPQIGLNANYQNNFQLPAVGFSGSYGRSGTYNQSSVALGLSQTFLMTVRRWSGKPVSIRRRSSIITNGCGGAGNVLQRCAVPGVEQQAGCRESFGNY
jgi:hypothetical protein